MTGTSDSHRVLQNSILTFTDIVDVQLKFQNNAVFLAAYVQ